MIEIPLVLFAPPLDQRVSINDVERYLPFFSWKSRGCDASVSEALQLELDESKLNVEVIPDWACPSSGHRCHQPETSLQEEQVIS